MKPLPITPRRLARTVSVLVALALVVVLSLPGFATSGAHAGAGHHVHDHVRSDGAPGGDLGALADAHDHECCRPGNSSLPCIGGCLVACGLFAGACAADLRLDHVDLWRAPSGTRPIGAEPDLATPPPKVLG